MSDRDQFVRVTSDPVEEESSDSMSILRAPIDVSIFCVCNTARAFLKRTVIKSQLSRTSDHPNSHVRWYLYCIQVRSLMAEEGCEFEVEADRNRNYFESGDSGDTILDDETADEIFRRQTDLCRSYQDIKIHKISRVGVALLRTVAKLDEN